MAGWSRYSEESGEIETGMYEYPFIVRETPQETCAIDVSVASFSNEKAALEWIERNKEYYGRLHVENWNQEQQWTAEEILAREG